MRHGVARASRGFTLLELAIAILIIGALATVLLSRLAYYQELAEKAAMEAMVRVIKTGLQIRLAELIAANRQAQAATLEIEDPMQWLEAKPGNYGGPYQAPAEGGTWYFDAGRRQLVYVVKSGNRPGIGGSSGEREIRFQARLLKDRLNVAGGAVESVTAVTLKPVTPYRWP
jgi:prepilin-type N-terminal cleavage/methylation domain-containing protein